MAHTAPVSPDPSGRPKTQTIALGVLYALLVALALWVIADFIPAIVWACVIAIALWPALHRIEAQPWFAGRKTLIAAALTAAVALLLVVPVVIGLVQAAGQTHELFEWVRGVQQNGIPVPDAVSHLPFGAQQVDAWWQANLAKPLHASTAVKGVNGETFLAFTRHFGSRVAHAAVLFGFMLVTLFVIFQAGPRLSGALLKGVQRAFGADGAALIQRMVAAVHGTVTGLVVVGLGEGALLGVAYAVAGVPHAALLGLVTAVAAMLPFCAPLVFCGAALWLFAQGMAGWAIGLAAFGFVVVFIAEHFVRPVLIGSSARLPFLLVLFGILGGAETFGLLGLFIGPALMTVLTVLWAEWVD
ncbi:AI-2E family transporter [Burkholderia alba]|uniref:AI-2E family transporter n=1 Tax=Burkholderia alba TaxID=2683677 RepID=UPI002B0531B1|nr:AI-2E family transporter [Burkholderia alba]